MDKLNSSCWSFICLHPHLRTVVFASRSRFPLGKIYEEIRFGIREDETSAPPLTRSELLDIAVKRMDMVGFGELTEEDFEAVKEELLEDGMDPDLVNQLTYDEVLQRISDIENAGMDR